MKMTEKESRSFSLMRGEIVNYLTIMLLIIENKCDKNVFEMLSKNENYKEKRKFEKVWFSCYLM